MQYSNKFIGKKLLILGANPETVPLIQTAQQMGVTVIVTDNNPNAFAKAFADQSFDVDGLDVNGIVQLARNENVDGVLVGVADRLIVPYQQVCDVLNFPCYATEAQCNVFTDKEWFHDQCKQFEIPTIPNYNLGTDFPSLNKVELAYPVIVKPVDGNSGKGISICHSDADLELAIEKAKKASKRKKYLVEKYMNCDDIFLYFTFRDGEIMLSATADRYTSNEQGDLGKVCIGAMYPSKYSNLYFEKLHAKLISLFKSLDMKNGILMISAFVENNEIYVYDPGFRLQGESPNIPIEAICSYDQKAMLIEFALGGQMGNLALTELSDYSFRDKFAATLWILSKEGEIVEIEGLEELKGLKNVYKIVQRLYQGDIVSRSMIGTEAQVVARVFLTSDSKVEMVDMIRKYSEKIKIAGLNNQSLNLKGLESRLITEE